MLHIFGMFILISAVVAAEPNSPYNEKPQVMLQTNMGKIVLELYPESAPKTVENFLGYVKNGFYDGTIFHRVIKGFMVQGGGFDIHMKNKITGQPIPNEADSGLKNERGTIAMARTTDPHSATSQFFINTVNNNSLNYRNKTMHGWGYCVFGSVISGMDVIEKIENQATTSRAGHRDVPVDIIVIEKVEVIE